MSVSRNRFIAYLLAFAVFLQLFGMASIASVKTKNEEFNIGLSQAGVSLAPPAEKPVYFSEKSFENGVVLTAVMTCILGNVKQSIITSIETYREFYPVLSRKTIEVFRE